MTVQSNGSVLLLCWDAVLRVNFYMSLPSGHGEESHEGMEIGLFCFCFVYKTGFCQSNPFQEMWTDDGRELSLSQN